MLVYLGVCVDLNGVVKIYCRSWSVGTYEEKKNCKHEELQDFDVLECLPSGNGILKFATHECNPHYKEADLE